MTSKMRNIPTEVDGIRFHSKKEASRYKDLKLLETAGEIENLRLQVPYILIPKQKGERECKYYADFVYEQDGQTIVEDAKGARMKEYIIKRKLMLFIHGIKVKET